MNARMDTLQAAVLLQKLTIFEDEIVQRNRIARRYGEQLAGVVATPSVIDGGVSVWAQYTIETDGRDGLAAALREQGVPTAVYYPVPIHRQPPYAGYPVAPGGLPVTDAKAGRVISLPMHPYLSEADQDLVTGAIRGHVLKNR
jgi:dTDP-4-amino-4,6-dideoxygalactose transaminase